ncbi:MAG: hypothetical protein A3A26_00610 [Candidatus Zambryskibacteria bacterium RIFCSPLOWO2_01_FULL_47_14]|uniref:Ribonuclease n=1 Tax=Candidatus Zambryskibacteria bacterium RIFCSPLOWO2_01_FULL_47_14 TaxID=1802763 RepID=A0A1G2U6K3_9BACT|nr:MAG: hypothetical protein A3A26_00610 [Candidatus Zambryskibacteria bacterium RIFCSPLOWO2_01_FULL_47_14]
MIKHIIGIDEVGRGPLAGPITFCAFCAHNDFNFKKFRIPLKDSKQLNRQKREEIFKVLNKLSQEKQVSFSISSASNILIDKKGLSFCIKKCISDCLKKLSINSKTTKVLLDGGLHAPSKFIFQETIVKGDTKKYIIAFASIVAKVSRDKYMTTMSRVHPHYSFEKNKGYGTALHIKAIKKHGPSKIHRKSFLKNIF